MLNIHLLGKITLEWNGQPLGGQLADKSIALLYLLIQSEAHFLTRDKLSCYLWPDSAPDAARYNLRYHVWLLKKYLPAWEGRTLILSEKDGCRLNQEYPWWSDLTVIREIRPEQSDIDQLLRICGLFSGEVMEGWYLKNCNEFNELILLDRMMCERKQITVLQALSEYWKRTGENQRCLEVLQKIAFIEPNNEDAALEMMEAYLRMGERVRAIRYYKQFETTLLRELGITPNERLQSLYGRIKDGGLPPEPIRQQPASNCTILLRGQCMPGIRYFLLADLLTEILQKVGSHILTQLDEHYIRDLIPIHTNLALGYERETGVHLEAEHVLDVRIISAFCKLIQLLCRNYEVHLRIIHRDSADPVSCATLQYLEKSQIEHLIFE